VVPADEAVSELRPYIRTRGRVGAREVAFDALLVAAPTRSAVPLCRQTTGQAIEVLAVVGESYLTVAELAARMRLPLGTAQVIVADLAREGVLRLVDTVGPAASTDDERIRTLALLGSVIDGIGEL